MAAFFVSTTNGRDPQGTFGDFFGGSKMVVQSLLTPEQAAVILGVSHLQLKSLPSLPVVMIGLGPRYRVRDLERWILSRRVMPLAGIAR